MHPVSAMRPITELMTRQPWTVQVDDSIAVARRMVAEREIRHLPVFDAGTLIGIVTDRDLLLSADHASTVGDVMAPIHVVATGTPLDEVLDAMIEHRWDAVAVTDEDELTGIFTSSDAVRALRDTVRDRRARAH
jgi:CBS domain-containing protein